MAALQAPAKVRGARRTARPVPAIAGNRPSPIVADPDRDRPATGHRRPPVRHPQRRGPVVTETRGHVGIRGPTGWTVPPGRSATTPSHGCPSSPDRTPDTTRCTANVTGRCDQSATDAKHERDIRVRTQRPESSKSPAISVGIQAPDPSDLLPTSGRCDAGRAIIARVGDDPHPGGDQARREVSSTPVCSHLKIDRFD